MTESVVLKFHSLKWSQPWKCPEIERVQLCVKNDGIKSEGTGRFLLLQKNIPNLSSKLLQPVHFQKPWICIQISEMQLAWFNSCTSTTKTKILFPYFSGYNWPAVSDVNKIIVLSENFFFSNQIQKKQALKDFSHKLFWI